MSAPSQNTFENGERNQRESYKDEKKDDAAMLQSGTTTNFYDIKYPVGNQIKHARRQSEGNNFHVFSPIFSTALVCLAHTFAESQLIGLDQDQGTETNPVYKRKHRGTRYALTKGWHACSPMRIFVPLII